MKIVVVGGLGYLGSVLTDLLHNKSHEVDVVDMCLYDNEDVASEISFDTLHKTDVTRLPINFFDKYERIYWLAHSDVDYMYRSEELSRYTKKHDEYLIELNNKSDSELVVVYHFLGLEEDRRDNEFVSYRQSLKKLTEANVKGIFVGSLFGPSPRMRWDTYFNNLVYEFINGGDIVLDGAWANRFPYISVYDAASELTIEEINFSSDMIMHTCRFSMLELAHLIKTTIPTQTPIITSRIPNKISDFEVKNKASEIRNTVISSVSAILKGLENNALPDFRNDKYNNVGMLYSINQGLKALRKFDNG